MAKGAYSIRDDIREWFSSADSVVIAGIGNPIRRDDFVGMKIVQDLKNKISEKVHLIECETVPESFMQDIVDLKPSHVLLIDAAFLGLKPGEAKLVFPEQVANFTAVTTHVLPLRIFCEYIEKMTEAKIALLLIEPENTEFGEGLTPTVQATAEKLERILLELFSA
ncbi:MAG: hydrogenase 3 maturation endopeptidase HyCI [Candidatus Bathyarchaeota archaeon]|nr:hydrogenase 3 maturation endopeptidase HyCI [Candidatus Bathyarchaeota archaeon]